MVVIGIRNTRWYSDDNINGERSRALLSSAPTAGLHVQVREEGESRFDNNRNGVAGCHEHKNWWVGSQRHQWWAKEKSQHLHRDPHTPQASLPRRANERTRQRSIILCDEQNSKAGSNGWSWKDHNCFHPSAQQWSLPAFPQSLPFVVRENSIFWSCFSSQWGKYLCYIYMLRTAF